MVIADKGQMTTIPQIPRSYLGRFLHAMANYSPAKEDKDCVNIALSARKFVFPAKEIYKDIPKVVEYAEQLIEVGVFSIPFDAVLYEFVGFGEDPQDPETETTDLIEASSFLLAWKIGNDIAIRNYRYGLRILDRRPTFVSALYTGLWSGQKTLKAWVRDPKILLHSDDSDKRREYERKSRWWELENKVRDPSEPYTTITGNSALNLFLGTAILNLGAGIKIEKSQPRKATDARLAKQGKPHQHEHYVVKVDLHSDATRASGGTHASPRPHWRRGHVRTLATGVKVLVKACLVGKPEGPLLEKVYDVKAARRLSAISR